MSGLSSEPRRSLRVCFPRRRENCELKPGYFLARMNRETRCDPKEHGVQARESVEEREWLGLPKLWQRGSASSEHRHDGFAADHDGNADDHRNKAEHNNRLGHGPEKFHHPMPTR